MRSPIITLFLFGWLAAKPVLAYESGGLLLPISVSTTRLAPPGCLPDIMIHINLDTNQFIIRMPAGYRMASDYSTHGVVLSRADNICKLAFRMLALPANASPADPTTYRDWIYSTHPGAKILNQFDAHTSNLSGPAFSVQWRRADGLIVSEQIAYIPCAAGILEFSSSSIVTYADTAASELQLFLMAFRAPINGKLETPFRFNQS